MEEILSELPFVSVIIVNYNGAHFLPTCLEALRRQTYPGERFEVIVVDNASTDGSLEMLRRDYPAVILLANQANLGFAGGNNAAMELARGQFLVLLNNDTQAEATWLEALVQAALAHPEAGLVTGHLVLFYDQLEVFLECDTFTPPGNGRALGVQVFQVESGAAQGVVQYLEGFCGSETQPTGEAFRWTQGRARLGIPVPPGEGAWRLQMRLASPRPDSQPVKVRLSHPLGVAAEWDVSGTAPFEAHMPAATRRLGKAVEQNTGSVLFRSGASRDRGTHVQGSQVIFETDDGRYTQDEEVFAGCGANLLLRRELLDEAGLFDTDFFMYYEDTDLSWRVRLLGWKVMYAAKAVVRHVHCGSTREWSPAFIHLTERNRLATLFKNASPGQALRGWLGYLVLVARLALLATGSLLRGDPAWRSQASQARLHLRVLGELLAWLPSLWRKRRSIQLKRRVPFQQIESWFLP
ncbi:MAG: glycosyltransferase family 2 protein [Anaerolineales bacterium]|nr:glycosyltransferase family 2 protein [Anaerolineales bacterium]